MGGQAIAEYLCTGDDQQQGRCACLLYTSRIAKQKVLADPAAEGQKEE